MLTADRTAGSAAVCKALECGKVFAKGTFGPRATDFCCGASVANEQHYKQGL